MRHRWSLPIAAILGLLLTGCLTKLAGGPESSEPITPEQLALAKISQGYVLPEQSIPPSPHPDPRIAHAMQAIQQVAEQQGLVFDGRQATEGYVAVGKPGKYGPMVLIMKLYWAEGGRLAFQHTAFCNGMDFAASERMKERFLNALQ